MARLEADIAQPVSLLRRIGVERRLALLLSERLRAVLGIVGSLVVFSALTLLLFRPYLQPGFAGGYDTLIHFFKVSHVKSSILQHGWYTDWNDQWYAGYHQFLFYPPLFYTLAVIVELAVNNLALTSKMLVVLGVLIAGFTSFFLARAILPVNSKSYTRNLAAFVAACAYAFSPALMSFIVSRGKYPDYYAIAFAPLAFLLLVRWLESEKRRPPIAFSLALASLLLFHIDTAVVTGLAALVYAFIYQKQSLGNKGLLFNPAFYRPLAMLLLGCALSVGLTAFFWMPYLTQIKTLGALDQLFPSRIALPPLVYWRDTVNGISRYPGLLTLFLALAPLFVRRLRPISKEWLTLLILGFGAGLFAYTPLATKYPEINMILFRSGVALMILSISMLTAINVEKIFQIDILSIVSQVIAKLPDRVVAIMPVLVAPLITVLIVAVMLLDYSFMLFGSSIKPKSNFKGGLAEAIEALKEAPNKDQGRTLVLGPSFAEYTYLPVVTGKPVINGYEAQASRMAIDVEQVKKAMTKKGNESYLFSKLDQLNIEYLFIDTAKNGRAEDHMLETGRFAALFSNSRYSILEYKPRGFVQSIKPALVVGSNQSYPMQALSSMRDIGFVQGGKLIDDYSVAELSRYPVVILYNFEARKVKDAEGVLKEYLENGGRLILSMDSSLSSLLPDESFLGVKPVATEFNKTSTVDSAIPVKLDKLDNDVDKWSGTYYSGLEDVWLTVDGRYPVMGTKTVGKGKALFVGYNLFYHAIYKKNDVESGLLQAAVDRLVNLQGSRLKHESIAAGSGKVAITVEPEVASWSLISMSWSPYWKAYIDGKEVATKAYENLTAVYLPAGKHRLELVYELTPVHLIAVIISVLTLIVALVIAFFPFMRGVVKHITSDESTALTTAASL